MIDVGSLSYDGSGLIPVIAQDSSSGEVLMLAWMNEEALRRTIETREAGPPAAPEPPAGGLVRSPTTV